MGDAAILVRELDRFRAGASHRRSPAFGTAHVRRALNAFGDPQDRIGRAIHITGTNGKGSTGAFIRAMAEAAGLSVHVFTSPHLTRVNERIRIAGRLVDDAVLAGVLGDIWRRAEDLTYFEALTVGAYCLFAQVPADLAVIEVGAGGTGDATNVMTQPAATIVTPISRDHEAMFGVSGVAAIARVKSGIFRKGAPAVIAEQPALALGVLREEARASGAILREAGEHWSARWEGEAFVYQSPVRVVRSPWLGLRGRHQAQNAGAACAALEVLADRRITAETMAAGLREAAWPGRLQRLMPGPLAGEDAVWVDAAHNPGGAASLAGAIRSSRAPGERVGLVLALQAAKDIETMLSELLGAFDVLAACPLPDSGGQEGGPGADPRHVAGLARMMGARAEIADGLPEAMALLRQAGADRIYICGSVYLCGAALALNGEQVS